MNNRKTSIYDTLGGASLQRQQPAYFKSVTPRSSDLAPNRYFQRPPSSNRLSSDYFVSKSTIEDSKISTSQSRFSRWAGRAPSSRHPSYGNQSRNSIDSPEGDGMNIFIQLSDFLKRQDQLVDNYKTMASKVREKISHAFQNTKKQLAIALQKQQILIYEQLNGHVIKFMSMIQDTKYLIQQLYVEKQKYYQQIEPSLQYFNTVQANLPPSNTNIVQNMQTQNVFSAINRKYETFIESSKEAFRVIIEKKKEVERYSQTEIFNFQRNYDSLKRLKQSFTNSLGQIMLFNLQPRSSCN